MTRPWHSRPRVTRPPATVRSTQRRLTSILALPQQVCGPLTALTAQPHLQQVWVSVCEILTNKTFTIIGSAHRIHTPGPHAGPVVTPHPLTAVEASQ